MDPAQNINMKYIYKKYKIFKKKNFKHQTSFQNFRKQTFPRKIMYTENIN